MIRDFTSGLRQFVHKPFFSALVVMLVAVGIGANILIFGIIDTLLLKPLPVRNPENLWVLQTLHSGRSEPDLDFTYGQFEELQNYQRLFSGLTAEQAWGSAAAYPSGENGGVRRLVMTQMVAPNYFKEMAVGAAVGRVLDDEDAKASSNIPAVLSYQFWQSRYGGRKDILGQTLRIKNFPFTIVGVLPRDFHSIDIERAPDVRLPISAALLLHGRPVEDPRGEFHEGFHIFVRLRNGVHASQVEQVAGPPIRKFLCNEFILVNTALPQPFSPADVKGFIDWFNEGRLGVAPIGQGRSLLRTRFQHALQLLMGGVIILLITVCANVTGLLLARGEERRKDLALRLSIGAGRWRLLRLLLIENLCLAVPGALLGWILAFALAPLLIGILPPIRSADQFASPPILSVTPDLRILLFAWLAILLSICFFGLFPAWRAMRLDFGSELRGASALAAHSLASLVPVTIQIALSVLLLAAGGVMLRTYWNLEHLNPGFDREHVVSFTLGMKDGGFTKPQARAYLSELEERIKNHGGVRAVAHSFAGLMRGTSQNRTITVPGANPQSGNYRAVTALAISPSYFETLGIPLVKGRPLSDQDAETKPAPVVVNRPLAALLFPHTDPIGKSIVLGRDATRPPDYQVVGLVETAKYRSMQEVAPPTLYTPMQDETYTAVVYVRTAGSPLSIMPPVLDEIRKMGGGVSVIEARTLEQEIQNSLWQERLVAGLACFFSFVALLLAGIGLYGTLAYSVARRRRELGIRLAIGAQVRHIIATVCGRMTWAVGIGIVIGWSVSAAALRFARGFLFDVEPFDKPSFSAATVAVLFCVLLAALIPSWRAIRTNASTALREQ